MYVNKQSINNIALYMRLSKEDGDIEESESIVNQRNIIYDFINENFNFKHCYEYTDDGYTGANFNRPGFRKMIKDIENNKIDLVITKNLARFGRNYIDSGEYIEKEFLNQNIRYIAILDKVDNFEDKISNDFVPIKGVFNEMFCKETSKNIKNSKRKKMQEGFYACTIAPFGYKKDPNEQGKLVIDKEPAKIVKKIFELKLEGLTQKEIAEYLNKEKIKTPSQYLKIKGLSKNISQIWTRISVGKILCNKIYLGDCIRGKTQNISYKTKKRINIKRNDFVVVQNTHEPIITREMYEEAHKKSKTFGTIIEAHKKIETKFGNFIYCYYCGKKIEKRNVRGKINLHCRNNRNSNELCDFSENYFYEEIEPLIINNIRETFEKYFKDNCIKTKVLKNCNFSKLQELNTKNKEQDKNLRKITFKISKLYNDRLNGIINEEDYKNQYSKLVEERKKAIEEKENTDLEIREFQNRNCDMEKITKIKSIIKNLKSEDLTLDEVRELITKIELGKGFIYIHYKFEDINTQDILQK